MARSALVHVIEVGNELGESVQWNASDGSAWWTDIERSCLYRWRLVSGCIERFAMPERAGSFAFIDGQNDDELMIAFETGIARHHLGSGRTIWIARPEAGDGGRRFNDGRADRQGRFWAGTMVEDPQRAQPGSGNLYCIDGEGTVSHRLAGIQISNGLCFSPDSRYCYFADSPLRVIFRFDFDAATGELGRRSVFAETSGNGFPDGATVDCEGCVWSAHWGSGRVIRYAPDGRIDREVAIPTRQPSCVAFGGRSLEYLFVTSARQGLTAATLAGDPMAGHVFVLQTGSAGLPEPQYRPYKKENRCPSPLAAT